MDAATQSNRVPSLDLARILAMLMMISGHTFFSLVNPKLVDVSVFPWSWWEFLRGVTAPIFLTVSGIVQVFANKRDAKGNLSEKTITKRYRMGLLLIAIGYILMFPADRIYDIPFLEHKYLEGFFAVNILQLFGLSLLFVLISFILTKSDKILFKVSITIALLITLLSPFSQLINWFSFLPYPVASYFDYRNGSFFGVFPFSAYLFYGLAFGTKLKQIDATKRINYIIKMGFRFIPVSLALGTILLSLELPFLSSGLIPYKVSIGFFFLRFSVVALVLALTGMATIKLPNLHRYFTFFGQKALYVYILHIIVLYGTSLTPGLNTFFGEHSSVAFAYVNIPIVLASTMILTYTVNQLLNSSKRFNLIYKFSITAYLVYLLFI